LPGKSTGRFIMSDSRHAAPADFDLASWSYQPTTATRITGPPRRQVAGGEVFHDAGPQVEDPVEELLANVRGEPFPEAGGGVAGVAGEDQLAAQQLHAPL
jgi:hypothetical protein